MEHSRKWRRFEGQGVSFFIIETVQFKTDFITYWHITSLEVLIYAQNYAQLKARYADRS